MFVLCVCDGGGGGFDTWIHTGYPSMIVSIHSAAMINYSNFPNIFIPWLDGGQLLLQYLCSLANETCEPGRL